MLLPCFHCWYTKYCYECTSWRNKSNVLYEVLHTQHRLASKGSIPGCTQGNQLNTRLFTLAGDALLRPVKAGCMDGTTAFLAIVGRSPRNLAARCIPIKFFSLFSLLSYIAWSNRTSSAGCIWKRKYPRVHSPLKKKQLSESPSFMCSRKVARLHSLDARG